MSGYFSNYIRISYLNVIFLFLPMYFFPLSLEFSSFDMDLGINFKVDNYMDIWCTTQCSSYWQEREWGKGGRRSALSHHSGADAMLYSRNCTFSQLYISIFQYGFFKCAVYSGPFVTVTVHFSLYISSFLKLYAVHFKIS
jgi:hypothetical protein